MYDCKKSAQKSSEDWLTNVYVIGRDGLLKAKPFKYFGWANFIEQLLWAKVCFKIQICCLEPSLFILLLLWCSRAHLRDFEREVNDDIGTLWKTSKEKFENGGGMVGKNNFFCTKMEAAWLAKITSFVRNRRDT